MLDYAPDDWARLAYKRGRFLEAGGWLAVRPIEELPFYRAVMRRARDQPRMRRIADEHGEAIAEMRALLAAGREVVNREFATSDRSWPTGERAGGCSADPGRATGDQRQRQTSSHIPKEQADQRSAPLELHRAEAGPAIRE